MPYSWVFPSLLESNQAAASLETADMVCCFVVVNIYDTFDNNGLDGLLTALYETDWAIDGSYLQLFKRVELPRPCESQPSHAQHDFCHGIYPPRP